MALEISDSRASGQRCLYCGETYPLYPPVIGGCPRCATEEFKAPLALDFAYPPSIDDLLVAPLPGLARYAPLLPPLVERVSMGEGGTPLVAFDDHDVDGRYQVYIKDEARNPTWSHKDRLNLAIASTAVIVEAAGVVAASSGNHGAAAAAYSARAGLPAVILTTPRPPAMASFLQAYGQLVVAVPDVVTRWLLMEKLVDELGYHPASNQTTPPTNHPFGSENYKTIAYELYMQLYNRAPAAIFVPVGYAELLFGIYKGFTELLRYGLIAQLPRMMACEPAAGAPLHKAIKNDVPMATVDPAPSAAYAIAVPVNSYRGVVAVRESGGAALAVPEKAIHSAQKRMSCSGIWAESSAAISVAGLEQVDALQIEPGPIVCVNTSSGFKDEQVGKNPIPATDGSWQALMQLMQESGLL